MSQHFWQIFLPPLCSVWKIYQKCLDNHLMSKNMLKKPQKALGKKKLPAYNFFPHANIKNRHTSIMLPGEQKMWCEIVIWSTLQEFDIKLLE